MSADAIVMMVVAMLILWGGLVAAIISLNSRPDAEAQAEGQPEAGGLHRDL